jgi:hypothetical protein
LCLVDKNEWDNGWAWKFMPVISSTRKVEIRGLQFEDSPGKELVIPYLKSKLGLVVYT